MSKINKISVIANIVLVVVLVAAGSWFFLKYRKDHIELNKKYNEATKELESFKQDPSAVAQAEAQRIIEEVGKVYALPKDEKPTVGTVKNDNAEIEKLKKEQAFFANTQAGDITLIYTNAKIALLYRPSTKQLINVSSITIQDQQTPQPIATP